MEQSERQLIEKLGCDVLDGIPVDWPAIESQAGVERSLIESLKALAAVATLHRERVTTLDSSALARLDDPPTSGTWGHLEILERIGQGASAHVFRAWDTRLDREVALKLLPADASPEVNGNSPVIHEGRLLARVRHGNVVTIYGAERIRDLVGLWMEFVQGQTLEELARTSPFSAADTIEVGVSLCSAVSAVHRAGLLHRDIKAHNVMRASDGRIVLMDFGTGRERADPATTDEAGTPLYLAPELFRGGVASVQSDIYSVGVLLFRLLTGTYPRDARTLDELRRAHAGGPPERRDLRSRIPARLARAIERAIDPDPQRRWPDAEALRTALLRARSSRKRPLILAGMCVAAVGVALSAWSLVQQPHSEGAAKSLTAPLANPTSQESPDTRDARASTPAASIPPSPEPATPPAVAAALPPATVAAATDTAAAPAMTARGSRVRTSIHVAPLTNASGRDNEAWLSTTLAEMILREFRASEKFRWIPGAVPLAKAQLGQALITESSATIRPVIPADVTVSGEYVLRTEPDQVRVTLRLQRATGDLPITVVEAGSVGDLRRLVSRLGAAARSALGDRTTLRSSNHQPAAAEAARWYAHGIWGPRSPEDCVRAMQNAIAADPAFAPAHITLAECLGFVDRDREVEKRRRIAAQAMELAEGLPPEERLLIQIRARIVSSAPAARDSPNLAAYEELQRSFPDTLLYAFMVARGYAATDAPRALAAIDSVADVPGAREDLGLLRMEGNVAASVGDFGRAQRALGRAEALARELADGVLLGNILLEQSAVAHKAGAPLQELSLAEDALQSLIASGNHAAHRHARASVHTIYEEHGGFAWARKSYEELIGASAIRGNGPMLAHLRIRLGELLANHGRLGEARSLFDEVRRAGTEVMPYPAERWLRGGELLYRQGDLAGARDHFESALAAAKQKQDLAGHQEIWASFKLAQVALELGDLPGALEHAARNIQGPRETPTRERAGGLSIRARVAIAADDLASARAAADEASKTVTANRLTIQPVAFDVWMARALVALEQERLEEARMLAQQGRDLARRDLQPDREMEATVVIARAWLAEGRVDTAREIAAPLIAHLNQTEDRLLRLQGATVIARIVAAAPDPAQLAAARQRLESVVREAQEIGAVAMQFDARLALGEIQKRAGDLAGAEATLTSLEQDAAARGFTRLARQASAMKP